MKESEIMNGKSPAVFNFNFQVNMHESEPVLQWILNSLRIIQCCTTHTTQRSKCTIELEQVVKSEKTAGTILLLLIQRTYSEVPLCLGCLSLLDLVSKLISVIRYAMNMLISGHFYLVDWISVGCSIGDLPDGGPARSYPRGIWPCT